MGFEEVTPESLLTMDLDGGNLTPDAGRLHSEIPIHNEIYKARDDVNCVVHIHPFYATLLSSVWKGRLRIVNQHTQQFVGGIGLYESSELVRRAEQGRALAGALGAANAVLLKNHGVVVAGRSVQEALVLSVLLERAAQVHLALAQFDVVDEIPDTVARSWAEELSKPKHYQNKFDYWCRKLAREGRGAYTG
jgi:L-fuculose-phosphate aldolase